MAKNITNNKTKSKKSKKVVPTGNVYVFSGYNNTIVTVTDLDGNTICWGTSGGNSFKGSRKSTPYAASIVGQNTAKIAVEKGVREVTAFIKGVGSGKSQCVKAIRNGGLIINKIVDVTPIAHNGCRQKKRRRI
ncbi:30S ribosomal protein S11 [candidate division WWE3 bacterium CG_4_9_14_3_um_filter_34_6]|uniref:Small ribosomal subunit protein uS11 n=1 Tax=candidate division WWE3 bacterium CG_4_9_14_3_um_filter_34_6 TaxID=1975079 RepID=A0A2M7X4F4_UNCKA|nr:MAG: 30S ribosomal protein S11 [candidate division WWE3 bacterium CG_4_9_14_3_um_filter_34_6]